MLRFCVLEKYRLPAEKKHQEFLKSKAEQEQKIAVIKMLKAMNYTQIFAAGPNASLNNTNLLETIEENSPVLSK